MTSVLEKLPPAEVGNPSRLAGKQWGFTFTPVPGETIAKLCRRMVAQLEAAGVTPLLMMVYGNASAYPVFCEAVKIYRGELNWPLTWVEGAACDHTPVAGIQVYGFTGKVEPIYSDEKVIGSVFNDGGLRHCLLGGLSPVRGTGTRGRQTAATLEQLQSLLASAGFDFSEVVRTWFFLDDILDWYDEFNQVRTGIYSGVKFQTGSLPASTGVGAKNPNHSALTMAAWAVKSEAADAGVYEVASPLQCPAPAYGSSFSRAMEINSRSGRQLLISGTASIAPGGKTLWTDDIQKQVELTMDVVEAILRSRGFDFMDLNRATAYFKHPRDVVVFKEWCRAQHFDFSKVVCSHCAVCRDDLLFELEADALKSFS